MLFERLLMAASHKGAPSSSGILSWGSNMGGCTGQGTTSGYTMTPTLISGTNYTWLQISASQQGPTQWVGNSLGGQVAAIRSDGTLWTWGSDGTSGLIGQGGVGNITVPTKVGSATNWVSVAQGGIGGLGVRADGTLWAWGLNFNSQLGRASTTTPAQVGSGTNWAKVFTSNAYTTFIIDTSGQLWTMGTPVGYENGLSNLGNPVTSPTQVGVATNWEQIVTCGDSSFTGQAPFTIGLQSNGTIWSVGSNVAGQTGQGVSSGSTTSFTQIGSGTNWSYIGAASNYIITNNSTVYGSGLAVQTNGTLWGWGASPTNGQSGATNTPTQIGSATTWTAVCGASTASSSSGVGNPTLAYALGLQSDGTIWSWGSNVNYQAGQGSSTISYTPTQIGVGTNWYLIAAGGSVGITTYVPNTACYGFAAG